MVKIFTFHLTAHKISASLRRCVDEGGLGVLPMIAFGVFRVMLRDELEEQAKKLIVVD